MPASKAQRAATADRRRRAIALKLAGADYESIARALGYASRGAVHTDITRALEASLREQAHDLEIWRHEGVLSLQRLKRAVWAAALSGDLKAAEVALKIVDRLLRLTGADLPARVEVITMSAIEAEISRLSAELAADAEDGEVPREPGLRNGLVGSPEAGASP